MMCLFVIACLISDQFTILEPEVIAPPDVTQKLTKTVGQSTSEFEALSKRLKELKDPTKKESGETNAEYLERVNEIFKGRALYIHKMHLLVQENLEAQFKLQEYLVEYKGWAEAVAKELDILPGQYQKRVGEIKSQVLEKARDMCVLADLIKTEIKNVPEKIELFKECSKIVNDKSLAKIADRNIRVSKFATLSISEKETALQKMHNFIKDSNFESNLLTTSIISETKALADILPKEHLVRIEEIRGVLIKAKENNLEDRAAEISILSEYFGKQLDYVEPDNQKDFLTVLKIDKASVDIQKTLNDFLKLTPGSQNMKLSVDIDLEKILDNNIPETKSSETKR